MRAEPVAASVLCVVLVLSAAPTSPSTSVLVPGPAGIIGFGSLIPIALEGSNTPRETIRTMAALVDEHGSEMAAPAEWRRWCR